MTKFRTTLYLEVSLSISPICRTFTSRNHPLLTASKPPLWQTRARFFNRPRNFITDKDTENAQICANIGNHFFGNVVFSALGIVWLRFFLLVFYGCGGVFVRAPLSFDTQLLGKLWCASSSAGLYPSQL
ncbi:hypothetical protein FZ928_11280 [Klebsiella pneumoniae]|uniref:Transmembrane protein n=1 Tax=Klebsiella pneumoniae TaxID=573 RepID=A0A5C2LJD3_KLEPN|nr:hypothetical protein FZ928_11280 [Klebsiella pneumoniae]